MNLADRATWSRYDSARAAGPTGTWTPFSKEFDNDFLEKIRTGIENAKKKLESLLGRTDAPKETARILGLLASTEKRQAETYFSTAQLQGDDDTKDLEQCRKSLEQCWKSLEEARQHYWESFIADRANSWSIVQYLSLTLVMSLGAHLGEDDAPDQERWLLWNLAQTLSLNEHRWGDDPKAKVWALGNLLELQLLSLVEKRVDADKIEAKATEYAFELAAIAKQHPFELYSTRRQIGRYADWFFEPKKPIPATADHEPAEDPAATASAQTVVSKKGLPKHLVASSEASALQSLAQKIFNLLPEGDPKARIFR